MTAPPIAWYGSSFAYHDEPEPGPDELNAAADEARENLIANAVHAFLGKGLWDALRRDPGLVGGAVEEAARFDPPVLGVLRRATRDVTLGGVPVPAGAELVVMVAAANRDPERFPAPDDLDARRSPNPHLSFGLGPHYCPGAALTELTARTAVVAALLDTFPTLRIADPHLSWRDHDPIVRGLTRLPVRASMPLAGAVAGVGQRVVHQRDVGEGGGQTLAVGDCTPTPTVWAVTGPSVNRRASDQRTAVRREVEHVDPPVRDTRTTRRRRWADDAVGVVGDAARHDGDDHVGALG